MKKKHSLFSYKPGKSWLHRCPAWIKILLIPVLGIVFFNLPLYFSVGLIAVQFTIACCLHFTIREQLEDCKPVGYYAVLLYATRYIGFSISRGFMQALPLCLSDITVPVMLIKLLCVMQSASLIFKTSTSLEIREGIGTIETAIRNILPVSKKNTVTDTVALFVCFIPMVHAIWLEAKRAWFARHGKHSIKMYGVLLPLLFSVGMKKAYNSAKAIAARS